MLATAGMSADIGGIQCLWVDVRPQCGIIDNNDTTLLAA